MQTNISFNYEEIDFCLKNEDHFNQWVTNVFLHFDVLDFEITYIFCSDPFLLDINNTYLNHDYLTDIITFPLNDKPISADIFISIDRVKENAEKFSQVFDNELLRVMSHGILHLIGHNDKTDEEKENMRIQEDICISLFNK